MEGTRWYEQQEYEPPKAEPAIAHGTCTIIAPGRDRFDMTKEFEK